jgi:hypothetical protein
MLQLFKGPNSVDVSLLPPEDGETDPVSETFCFIIIYNFKLQAKSSKPRDTEAVLCVICGKYMY